MCTIIVINDINHAYGQHTHTHTPERERETEREKGKKETLNQTKKAFFRKKYETTFATV